MKLYQKSLLKIFTVSICSWLILLSFFKFGLIIAFTLLISGFLLLLHDIDNTTSKCVLPSVREDKANHFIYGSVIAFITFIFTSNFYIPLVACFTISLTKELFDKYDKKSNSQFDILDIVWSMLGSTLVVMSYML